MSALSLSIRHAHADDLPAIQEIFNEVILNSTAVYTDTPVTLDNRRAWLQSRVDEGFPVLVAADAADDTRVLGFASYGPFRPAWPGYRHTVEHSVHVHAAHRGQGIGSALIRALMPLARGQQMHVMLGVIDAENEGSIRLHERLGFRQAGRLSQAGRKFGRWLDVVFVERRLDAVDETESR